MKPYSQSTSILSLSQALNALEAWHTYLESCKLHEILKYCGGQDLDQANYYEKLRSTLVAKIKQTQQHLSLATLDQANLPLILCTNSAVVNRLLQRYLSTLNSDQLQQHDWLIRLYFDSYAFASPASLAHLRQDSETPDAFDPALSDGNRAYIQAAMTRYRTDSNTAAHTLTLLGAVLVLSLLVLLLVSLAFPIPSLILGVIFGVGLMLCGLGCARAAQQNTKYRKLVAGLQLERVTSTTQASTLYTPVTITLSDVGSPTSTETSGSFSSNQPRMPGVNAR